MNFSKFKSNIGNPSIEIGVTDPRLMYASLHCAHIEMGFKISHSNTSVNISSQ